VGPARFIISSIYEGKRYTEPIRSKYGKLATKYPWNNIILRFAFKRGAGMPSWMVLRRRALKLQDWTLMDRTMIDRL